MEQMKEYVITLLERYNSLRKEIEALEFELENIRMSVPEEMIEAMQFSSPNGERVSGGTPSDKTPDVALTYRERFSQLTTQAVQEIGFRLAYLSGMIRRLEHSIDMLDAHQAAIIREYYFERYSWRELQELSSRPQPIACRFAPALGRPLHGCYAPISLRLSARLLGQHRKGISSKTLIKYRNDGIAALAERYQVLADLGILEALDSDYNTSTTKLQ